EMDTRCLGVGSSWERCFVALLALALFDPGVATAQRGKEIKLTEKHIQSFMAAYNDMVKVYESADPDKPDDPKVEAQVYDISNKTGFASLAEFDDVSLSISAVLSGIDPQCRPRSSPSHPNRSRRRSRHSRQTKPSRKRRRNRT